MIFHFLCRTITPKKLNMKNYLLIATILFFVTACSNQSEVDKANRERDSLAAILNERDSSMTEFMASYNEIERNLDSVAVRQNIVTENTQNSGEFKATSKEKINAQIAAINNLMEENRKK